MNDRDLQVFLRMAREIDDLEASVAEFDSSKLREDAQQGAVRHHGTRSPRRSRRHRRTRHISRAFIAGMALAAAITFAIMLPTLISDGMRSSQDRGKQFSGVPRIPVVDPPTNHEPVQPRLASESAEPPSHHLPELPLDLREIMHDLYADIGLGHSREQSVMLAIFKDQSGECTCLQYFRDETGAGGSFADLGRSELLSFAIGASCSANPERVVVLALKGRADSLPTLENAGKFVACVDELSDSHDEAAYARAALGCVSPDIQVRAETYLASR